MGSLRKNVRFAIKPIRFKNHRAQGKKVDSKLKPFIFVKNEHRQINALILANINAKAITS